MALSLLLPATTAWRPAPLPLAAPLAAPRVRIASAARMMATLKSWSPEDMAVEPLELPDAIEEIRNEETNLRATQRMWSAVRQVYATEGEAVAAAVTNPSMLLPYLNCPTNVLGTKAVLVERFGEAGALEVMRKNPGVLACNPREIRRANPEDIQRSADLVAFVDGIPAPLRLGPFALLGLWVIFLVAQGFAQAS